jgi:hypothetical protein
LKRFFAATWPLNPKLKLGENERLRFHPVSTARWY